MLLGSSNPLLFTFERRASKITLDVYFEDRGVVNEAIDDGERHGGIRKDLAPGAERLVRGDEHGPMLVTGTDQFEEDGGFRLIFADVGEIIEDQQMKAVEPVDRGFKGEFATSDLQPLNQVRGTGEQNAEAIFHQCEADRGREMISYRLPRSFLSQLRFSARYRRRAFLISAGMLNCSAMMALPSAVVIGLPVVSRNS